VLQKFKVKRAIKHAIRQTYDATDLHPAIIGLVQVYGLLTDEQKIRVWKSEFPHHYAFTPNLAGLTVEPYSMMVAMNGLPALDELVAISPMEWVSGSTRSEMIEYLISPELKELGKLRDTVWQGLVRGDFSAIDLDALNNAQSIIRKILRGIPECL